MTTFSSHPIPFAAPDVAAPRRRPAAVLAGAGAFGRALAALVEADRRFRERVALSRLPAHLRRDMGLPPEPAHPADLRW